MPKAPCPRQAGSKQNKKTTDLYEDKNIENIVSEVSNEYKTNLGNRLLDFSVSIIKFLSGIPFKKEFEVLTLLVEMYNFRKFINNELLNRVKIPTVKICRIS
jgi:hypothetical protein